MRAFQNCDAKAQIPTYRRAVRRKPTGTTVFFTSDIDQCDSGLDDAFAAVFRLLFGWPMGKLKIPKIRSPVRP